MQAVADDELAPLAIAQAALAHPGPLLVVDATLARADALAAGVRQVLDLLGLTRPVHLLPELEAGRDRLAPEGESERSRLLDLAGQPGDGVFVTSLLGAFAPLPAPARFRAQHVELAAGMKDWPPQRLAAYLTELDYDNEAQVHLPGEFSWRGGILDVFSPAHDYPVRLEYFGDELETLRFFDPETQRSLRPCATCRLIARGEKAWRDAEMAMSFPDYFPPGAALLVWRDLRALEDHLAQYGDDAARAQWQRHRDHGGARVVLETDALEPDLPASQCYHCPGFALAPQFRAMLPEIEHSWDVLHRQFLRTQLERWAAEGYALVLCCGSASKREQFQAQAASDATLSRLPFIYEERPLPAGAVFPEHHLVVLSEYELYGRARATPPRRRETTFHADYLERGGAELAEGDFAVHAAYGICRYHGITERALQGQTREVLDLEFDDEVRLYVPLEQAYLIGRYAGTGKAYPKLSKIGGSRWKTARGEAELAVKDLAADLLRLQAARDAAPGFVFAADTAEVATFDAAFPYEETGDQHRAIGEVAGDMARPKPMDRLLCGDVGFGKTEVAMRAAFRAVACGKQVAVVVPTTVLCQQHFLSFRERFKEYPVIIESLSRFGTAGEQHAVLAALREGRVDIVIGTHRLFSGDVNFKDLGLVVVDEEQRFGVLHKEKLKLLRTNVDVLTMTATPIPRTLYLSMSGLRDMSTIMTAPLARLPVQTIVAQYDDELIREAIRREVQRGGQAFFLSNRVQGIEQVRERLAKLVPEARFDIGHGQMHEHELEDAMVRFVEGQTDVLICTTIIESGLDIPNANTIIIDRADRFGLADLYQLRGRVGRYHRQAYAYLLIPRHGGLESTARERLNAIRRYTNLGAGFRLALRDLQIRGAGNLLGREQSGHINAIGFDLYCQLLRTAVSQLKHEPAMLRPEVAVMLDFLRERDEAGTATVSAVLPKEYINDQGLRLDAYRRLSGCTTVAQVAACREDLRDRFGALPPPAERVLQVAELRLLAAAAGLHSVTVRERKVYLEGGRGLLKAQGARLPRLHAAQPEGLLPELLALVRSLGK